MSAGTPKRIVLRETPALRPKGPVPAERTSGHPDADSLVPGITTAYLPALPEDSRRRVPGQETGQMVFHQVRLNQYGPADLPKGEVNQP